MDADEILTRVEAEWRAVAAVEQAHARFHLDPTEANADWLVVTIRRWRAERGGSGA